jgi:hypothetical protein
MLARSANVIDVIPNRRLFKDRGSRAWLAVTREKYVETIEASLALLGPEGKFVTWSSEEPKDLGRRRIRSRLFLDESNGGGAAEKGCNDGWVPLQYGQGAYARPLPI